jgi:hypothetical protein
VLTRSLILNATMRAKGLLILLSVTALGASTVGRHSSPVNYAHVAQPQPPVAKPVAFAAPVSPATTAAPSVTNNPAPTIKTQPEKVAATRPREAHSA